MVLTSDHLESIGGPKWMGQRKQFLGKREKHGNENYPGTEQVQYYKC